MKLCDLHKTLTRSERIKLAESVGVTPTYLWQIANGWVNKDGARKRPSVYLIAELAKADARLHIADMVAEFSWPKAKDKAEA